MRLFLALWLVIGMWAPAARGQPRNVEVQLDQFGVGSAYRPGDFTGVRLLLSSLLAEATPVWVQIEQSNADGDVAEYGRSLTLSPGDQQRPLWLYVPLPPDFDPRTVLAVRVFEERDGRRGRELDGARISPPAGTAVDISSALMAVVGPGQMRLIQYANPSAVPGRPVFAHEEARIVPGLRPEDLPDRWEGLLPFEVIAWGAHAPAELSDDQARALRQYVQRGGHLVISLPDAGNPWGLGTVGQVPLSDLMPARPPRKEEGVPIKELLPALSKSARLPENIPLSIRVFRELDGSFDAIDEPFQPLVATPDGRVFVVQRTFGFGHITLVGLDLTSGRLLAMPDSLQADIFWNRILGKRIDTPTGQELVALTGAKLAARPSGSENSLGGGDLVSTQITMSEQAGRGLLAAFLLFIVYWIVAGPGGFYALRQRRLERHAWVAFAAAAGVFTAAAWGVVTLIRPRDYSIQHLTYLDLLARPGGDRGESDPQYQRAMSWFSLHMPGYRRSPVYIESTPGQRDLMRSWSPPGKFTQPFPNPDRYRVDVGGLPADEAQFLERRADLTDFSRPSRATATQFYAHWLGGLDPDWGGTIRLQDPSSPIEIRTDATGTETGLEGLLVHDLPAQLTDVTVIWVKSQRIPPRRYARSGTQVFPYIQQAQSGAMLNAGSIWRLTTAWPAGQPLSLRELTRTPGPRLLSQITDRYVKDHISGPLGGLPTGATSLSLRPNDIVKYLEMLSLFDQLDPPKYMKQQPDGPQPETVNFYRMLGRELDLSTWFNRPCLIIIGHLRGVANPVPLQIDNAPPEVKPASRVVVRWICPLPLDETIAFRRPEAGEGP